MSAQRSATIEDVARASGVSRQTVSNVLNRPHVVRADTRDRVLTVIHRLGYAPHAAARRLRTRRSSTIGVHLDAYAGGISGAVLDRFVHALTEHADARGLRVLLYAARTPEQEVTRLRDLIDGGEIDAAVLSGTFHGDPRTAWLGERGLPFVSFGRPWGEDDVHHPAHPWVDVNGAAGTHAAAQHALETAGPRVAFLGWPAGSETGDDRESGWRDALGVRAGTADAPRLTAPESVSAARAVVAGVLQRQELDAIVCVSDSLAIGAHVAAVAAGRTTLSVIGFDNTPAAEALGLSSVEQLPEEVAAGALDLLAEADAGLPMRHVLVTPSLIVR